MSSTNTAQTATRYPQRRAWNVTLWVLQVLAAAMFLLSGIMKFVGAPAVVELFDAIGIGQWFRFLTGGLEVIGAVALLTRRFSAHGALLLAAVMAGAVVTELWLGGSPLPALVNLVVTAVIAWGRRDLIRAGTGPRIRPLN